MVNHPTPEEATVPLRTVREGRERDKLAEHVMALQDIAEKARSVGAGHGVRGAVGTARR